MEVREHVHEKDMASILWLASPSPAQIVYLQSNDRRADLDSLSWRSHIGKNLLSDLKIRRQAASEFLSLR